MEKGIVQDLVNQSGSIVPIVERKGSIKNWNQYQTQAATKEEVTEWVRSGNYSGFGLMMGHGDFHVKDIDQKNMPVDYTGSLFREIWSGIPEYLKEKLVVQRTRNGGEHIIFKYDEPAVSTTLATNPMENRDGKKNTKIIETIGSKNYILIEPSEGYEVVSGSLSNVQYITSIENYALDYQCKKAAARVLKSIQSVPPNSKTKLPVEAYAKEFNRRLNNSTFVSSSAVEIERSGIDITNDYEDWIRIGYGIVNEMGEDGREHFHKISGNYIGYDPDEVDKIYGSMLKGITSGKKSTGATLRHLMNKHKVPTHNDENKTAYKTNTAISFIKERGLQKNQFTNKVEQSNGELITDSDVNDIYLELRQSGLPISKMDVASIINSGNIEKINPLRDWIEGSEQFANDHVISDFLDCLKLKDVDPEMKKFIRSMVVKWLLQIPAMILDGTLPRLVLVAIGDTYIGKSELFRRLLPEEFKKYFAESGLDRDKDSEILMSEHLLVNVDELAGIMRSPKHVERFKSLSSSKYFTLRTPYGKINERFLRKAILCGTSNKLDILMDHEAGNSRIIPMELIDIDKNKYNDIDRNALFGSLTKMYREVGAGYLYLTPQEREMLQRKSEDHTVVNIEQELILTYYKPSDEVLENFFTVSDITNYLYRHTTLQLDPKKVSRELNKMGFIKARRRVNGSDSALNGFYVDVIYPDSDEIKNRFRGQ